jgi:putative tryptophan/tyrosine transport system substrate-binding protein
MNRRNLIALLGGAAVTWPLAARAQEPMPVIGFLGAGTPNGAAMLVAPFLLGLNEAGYVEGRNVTIEYRWAEGQYDRLPGLAADLARHRVSVIVTNGGTPPALAAKAATAAIPIVFMTGADPVKSGLVASLNRPGGNATGVAALAVDVLPKRLALLHEMVPGATAMALLINPANSGTETVEQELQAAGRTFGVQLHVLHASNEGDIDAAFAALPPLRAGGLVISSDAFFSSRYQLLGALTLRHAVPAIYQVRQFVQAGGLISYGARLTEGYRQAGLYTGRILKGEKPADLPVLQPTKFELIINLKIAKVIGLTIPESFLLRADELIE